ncbi:hypothetical protein B0T17DRAFT_589121 [Bombardia bombarda]|uniref:mRNA N(6)-methyladenine demethylase n=1 Tax=Bombardia bombarda TaxID=252184 RepID=A0AA39X8F3_9PEZI|nr:hypothetical protein B0T17DRAFT_589121 [Bombardia bombarda]
MAIEITELDAHEQPSDQLRAEWKVYAKAELKDLLDNPVVDDLNKSEKVAEFCLAGTIPVERLNTAFSHICPSGSESAGFQVDKDAPIYYHPILPGLLIVPSVVPPEVQKILLRHLIHRDLSNPQHQTNIHPHHEIPYPQPDDDGESSFFSYPPDAPISFEPKDPDMHRPLSIKQVLERRLHWVTLGGQYDWTNRIYPGERPPDFPADVAGFLETLFPETLAQAAIVNVYTPGDTMAMHRDVSEETDKGLVSISFGCDSLFMIAPNDMGKMSNEERKAAGESRFAWHGVPRVMKGTCPEFLDGWPAEGGKYEEWRGWMKNKRINLNVRQMRD